MQNTLRHIHIKFGSNWSSSFQREEFWKNVIDDRRRRTPSDCNSSIGLQPGELKIEHRQRSMKLTFYGPCPIKQVDENSSCPNEIKVVLRKIHVKQEFPTSLTSSPGWILPFKGNKFNKKLSNNFTQEVFGRTYHKDHFNNRKFLLIYQSFQDID